MGDESVTGAVTETPREEPPPTADGLVLSTREQVWVRNQYRKEHGSSKYIPHQGTRERQRRLRRRAT